MKQTHRPSMIHGASTINRQGGQSLVGVLVALVIGLLVLGGIAVIVQMSMTALDQQSAKSNLTTVRSKTKQTMKGQPDFTGLSNAVGISRGVFPASMVKTGGVIRNAWNGAVTIRPNAADPLTFDIVYAGLAEVDCNEMGTHQFGTWAAEDINGANVPQTGNQIAAIAGACLAAGNNTITYTSN